MKPPFDRRQFLRSAAALGLGSGLNLSAAGLALGRDEPPLTPSAVQFRPEIEPVVRWIEETPRDRILSVAIEQLKAGLSYRDLMAGLFLAGIRNVQPRPVGFKFHAVLVIHSAHLVGQTASVEERLLPMLWALDNFKGSQEQDRREGDWTLNRVDEARLPAPDKAKSALTEACEKWDADGVDVATAALCRTAGAAGTMEPFWRYGVRDHRDIGHKAIFAAQCWRTLQTVGWSHAEPVLRSLGYGLLDRRGQGGVDSEGPYLANLENAAKVRENWTLGKADEGATRGLMETLRGGSPEEASSQCLTLLNRGVAADSLWDAVVLAGGELLLRKPGIIALHAVTSANALHFIFNASGDDTTRKLALLQAVGWLPLFRNALGNATPLRLDALEPVDTGSRGEDAIASIFETASTDRQKAAGQALHYLNSGGSTEAIFAAGRRLIFHKGRDSHDYKFAAAAWEEALLASDPRWKAPLAAAALGHLPGSKGDDSPLMTRAQEAIKAL